MSRKNKQRGRGGVVLLGGGVLLAALLLKGNEEIEQDKAQATISHPIPKTQSNSNTAQPLQDGEMVSLQPLAVDVETEKRLLEEQRLAREKAVAEQEARAAEFLKMQQEAEAAAARKAAEQQKQDQLKSDAEKKLAEDKRKAEADKKAAEDKRKAEADKKAADDKKRKAEEDAKKKAEAEKARDLMENGDKKWMVQVALAANQANADAVVSKLRAKGYKVTTSSTSKGIRIMVGPAKDRDVADATRKKISSDESLNMKSAWVIDWVPLDQR